MAVISAAQKAAITPDMRVLEIGCGKYKRVEQSVALDIFEGSGADVIHNLNVFPYPFETNSFNYVLAEHVLEHLDNLIAVYEELHRILKPNGLLYVEVPHFSSANFFTDPTHRHAFSSRSFDYFIDGTHLASFGYSPIRFLKRSVHIGSGENNGISRMLGNWVNRHQALYEQRFAFILPKETLNFELEVIK